LNNVGRSIEMKSSIYLEAYKNKTSPDKSNAENYYRDIFLLFLETRYKGVSATGETFNKEGKADIVLKNTTDNSNLFIAECKVWHSLKQASSDAIEQLQKYITIRETKAALLIFVKDNDFTNKIEEFKNKAQETPCIKRIIAIDEVNYTYQYEISYRDEKNKSIELTVLFFHFPQK
jgi:hypothetical protein